MIAAALLTVIGAQIVALAVSARTFAVYVLEERPDRLLEWGRKHFGLEKGLLLGALLSLCGAILGGAIIVTWINRGFGELGEERMLVFASVLIILGVQTIFSSFFLSILKLGQSEERPDWPAPPA
jgi:hypothetical protein